MYEGVQNVQMFENTRDSLIYRKFIYRIWGIHINYTNLTGSTAGGFASLSDESYFARNAVQNVQRFKKH